MLNYRSCPKNNTGYPFFGLPCMPIPETLWALCIALIEICRQCCC